MVEADQRHEQADVGLRQLVARDVLLAAQDLLAAVQRRKQLAAGRSCVGAWPTQCVAAASHSRQAAVRMSGRSPKGLLVRRLLLCKACMYDPLPCSSGGLEQVLSVLTKINTPYNYVLTESGRPPQR